MQRNKKVWALVGLAGVTIGGALGRLHLIGPNPGTLFALGVLATLAVAGILYGLWEAHRIIRSGGPIGN